MAVCVAISLKAQTITDGSHWFDGRVLYTAHILDSGEIFFDAPENTEGTFCFSLRKEDFAEEQPVEEMIDGYLMNTAFLSRIPKEKLREMVSLLESRPARSIIEQTNLSLMRSELKVTEAERRGQL